MAELTPAQEEQLTAAYQEAFNVWLPQAEAAVLGGYQKFGISPDPAAINMTSAAWRDQVEQVSSSQLRPLAADAYQSEFPATAAPVAALVATGLIGGAAVATLAFLAAQVGEVQATLMSLISRSLNLAEAVAAIRQFMDPRNPHWAGKSRQFAQTEGDRWVQAATLAGAMAAQAFDGKERSKVWVSRDDDAVRFAHSVADGQRRRLGETFTVGGFPMMYPLDPAAPPDLVVNCRCKMRIDRQGVSRG
jgi:hypothetical protein